MTAGAEDRGGDGVGFWIGLVIGAGVLGFGVRGLVTKVDGERARSIAAWIVGADLAHDLLLAPIAITVGWLVGRRLPAWLRAPVTSGVFATGVVLLVAWPALRGYGRANAPGNPSVQPLNYSTATLTVLGGIWLAAGIWAAARARRPKAHSEVTPSP